MHVFDGTERQNNMAWIMDEENQNGDRVSISIINKCHPTPYSACYFRGCYPGLRHPPGLVFSDAVQRRLSCLYSGDAGTGGLNCGYERQAPTSECAPGCNRHWCDNGRKNNCAYRPTKLKEVMEIQTVALYGCGVRDGYGYNEGIVNVWPPEEWEAEMPGLVRAVFIQLNASDADWDFARRVHNAFHLRYPASAVPLLTYNRYAADEPFRLV